MGPHPHRTTLVLTDEDLSGTERVLLQLAHEGESDDHASQMAQLSNQGELDEDRVLELAEWVYLHIEEVWSAFKLLAGAPLARCVRCPPRCSSTNMSGGSTHGARADRTCTGTSTTPAALRSAPIVRTTGFSRLRTCGEGTRRSRDGAGRPRSLPGPLRGVDDGIDAIAELSEVPRESPHREEAALQVFLDSPFLRICRRCLRTLGQDDCTGVLMGPPPDPSHQVSGCPPHGPFPGEERGTRSHP